ncbi:hypothetical protein [Nostocoides vanveenii]
MAPPDPPAVPVPTTDNSAHAVAKTLTRRTDLSISQAIRGRAVGLLQTLAYEAARRGFDCSVPESGPVLVLTINHIDVEFTLHEEKVRGTAVAEEDRAKVRYSWQRAPLQRVEQWTGRLVLTLVKDPYNRAFWADRKRWTLESRLSLALDAAEEWAGIVKRRQDDAEAARQERRRQWEQAVPQAKTDYVDSLNRERVTAQLEAMHRAADLRAYADAVENVLPGLADQEQSAAREWASWIRLEADRCDPLLVTAELRYHRPENLPWVEVDRFMPRGMSSLKPPE